MILCSTVQLPSNLHILVPYNTIFFSTETKNDTLLCVSVCRGCENARRAKKNITKKQEDR